MYDHDTITAAIARCEAAAKRPHDSLRPFAFNVGDIEDGACGCAPNYKMDTPEALCECMHGTGRVTELSIYRTHVKLRAMRADATA